MKMGRFSIFILLFISIYNIPNAFSAAYTNWGLPDGAKIRIGKGAITGNLTFSPDNTQLAVASSIGIWIYDVNMGKEMNLLTDQTGPITGIAFSPDGSSLASSSYDELHLWDIATGNLIHAIPSNSTEISSVTFSPDGKTIASSSSSKNGTLQLWNSDTGTHKTTFTGHAGNTNIVTFSPDGTILASGGHEEDSILKLWNVATGELKNALSIEDTISVYGVTDIAFSPDGNTIACCTGRWDKKVYLLDVTTGALITTLIGHMGGVNSVAFSPDSNTLASGSRDGTVCLWDVPTGSFKTTLIEHTDEVVSVTFSADGKTLASGSLDGTVVLWDTESYQTRTTLTGHTYGFNSIEFSPDGNKIVSGNQDKTVRVWDTETGKNITTFTGHLGPVKSVSFSSDGHTIASGGTGTTINYYFADDYMVKLWDANSGTHTETLFGHDKNIFYMTFSTDGRILVSCDIDNRVVFWDTATGHPIWTFKENRKNIGSITFSPNGQTFAMRDISGILLYDINSRIHIKTLFGNTSPYSNIVFSPDGRFLATAGAGQDVHIWNVANGESYTIITGHTSRYTTNAFTADGQTLITAGGVGDNTVRFWDPKNGMLKFIYTDLPNGIDMLEFSPDGSTLAAVVDYGAIFLWDLDSMINPPRHAADVNGDGVVDIYDLVVVAANFGQDAPNDADVNGDGIVNIADLIKVAGAIENAAAAPLAFTQDINPLTSKTEVQKWLTQAQQLNITDTTSQRGIRFLEQLLIALTPKKTVLLQNYPNPFNPETWIPYQLSEPSDVSIQIYASDGHLIRSFDIGHQPAGLYQHQNRAAYWDGKNEIGEPVASGIYFYTLTAGKHTATRRMVIRK